MLEREALWALVTDVHEAIDSASREVIRELSTAAFRLSHPPNVTLTTEELIDGGGEPKGWTRDVWLGVELDTPKQDDDREMLHDLFFETAPQPTD